MGKLWFSWGAHGFLGSENGCFDGDVAIKNGGFNVAVPQQNGFKTFVMDLDFRRPQGSVEISASM